MLRGIGHDMVELVGHYTADRAAKDHIPLAGLKPRQPTVDKTVDAIAIDITKREDFPIADVGQA